MQRFFVLARVSIVSSNVSCWYDDEPKARRCSASPSPTDRLGPSNVSRKPKVDALVQAASQRWQASSQCSCVVPY